IEVLIAITIASFALLGLAGLQVTALKHQKVGHFRSLASQYSADMADRMRANVAGISTGKYIMADAYLAITAGADCVTAACTPSQVATLDLANWRTTLKNAVSGGWGEVSGDATNGYVITVYFNEPGKSTGGSLDTNCRAAAISSVTDKNAIRCFKTTFRP
ncbi:MAG: type IV pilus modification protein PilV, partial [Glaciimonas sp.]|nr:type IV pilus modification protein PilV [Glaciimonas sp.]